LSHRLVACFRLRIGALAGTNAIPSAASALLRHYFSDNHFDGYSPDLSSLCATSAVGRATRKTADSAQGSVLAMKTLLGELCIVWNILQRRPYGVFKVVVVPTSACRQHARSPKSANIDSRAMFYLF